MVVPDGLGAPVIAGIAAILAAAVGVTVVVARRLTASIRRLRDAAVTVGQGDLGVRVDEIGSEELVELAWAFSSMSHALAGHEELRRRLAPTWRTRCAPRSRPCGERSR